MLSDALCVPFSLYLHAMNYIQDAIQRTVSLKDSQNQPSETNSSRRTPPLSNSPSMQPSPNSTSPSSYFMDQMDSLVEGLSQRFDQLMGRAENCQKWIRSDATYPVPEPFIYQAALDLGQQASLEELLGNLAIACEHYWDAKLLMEGVLLSASEAADKRILQGYAKIFLDQFVICEKSKNSLLDYERVGVAKSYENKSSFSPGSASSIDSHVSGNSSTQGNTRNTSLNNL
jgi:hypothetical protein